jgi:hypothetical protein
MNSEEQTATKDPSFALEEIVPGTFALQGVLGGLIGGFVYILAMAVWSATPRLDDMLVILPLAMFVGAILGAMKATIIWLVHLMSDLRMGAGMRVALMINTLGVIAILLGRFSELRDDQSFASYLVIALLCALPTALLVGSRVKPWELFTFGSIAVYHKDVQTREGSRSVRATLGILPIRFLSIITLAVWILTISCERKFGADVIATASMFVIPAVYPGFCAYLSFRSPRKWNLLLIAIAINAPQGLISTAAFANDSGTYWLEPVLFHHLTIVYLAFVTAWAIFLIARLSLRTSQPMMASIGFSELLMQARKLRASLP